MPNINYVMNMTKSFLDGEIGHISYWLDFPYEIEKRYRKMIKEDRDYAELIYDCLIEEGTNRYDELSNDQFKRLIRKQYKSQAKDSSKELPRFSLK